MWVHFEFWIFRRRKGVYGPAMGKKIVLAFDDFEMSLGYGYTSQNIVELMRQLIEYQFWYDLEDVCRIDLIDFVSWNYINDDKEQKRFQFSRIWGNFYTLLFHLLFKVEFDIDHFVLRE